MNRLFIIKVKVLELIKCSFRPPPIMWTIGPRKVNKILSTYSNLFITHDAFSVSVLRFTPKQNTAENVAV